MACGHCDYSNAVFCVFDKRKMLLDKLLWMHLSAKSVDAIEGRRRRCSIRGLWVTAAPAFCGYPAACRKGNGRRLRARSGGLDRISAYRIRPRLHFQRHRASHAAKRLGDELVSLSSSLSSRRHGPQWTPLPSKVENFIESINSYHLTREIL